MQHREQLDLQQRAHVNWITQGDQGSKFFAHAIKARHVKNSIMETLNTGGKQIHSLAEMKCRAIDYLNDLYVADARHPPAITKFKHHQIK